VAAAAGPEAVDPADILVMQTALAASSCAPVGRNIEFGRDPTTAAAMMVASVPA
jgi:hypothetical protein